MEPLLRFVGCFNGLRLFEAVLPPGAFELITVSQASAKAIGHPFRPLKASDHVCDVDISVPGRIIGSNGKITTGPSFDRSVLRRLVWLGSVHYIIVWCHQAVYIKLRTSEGHTHVLRKAVHSYV